ncbi:hypothetical protein RHECNPAF_2330080 [Rhizobium etli CNPAF512]|nr:hypothetical protein RHECNPAF_2330080 [Rhizobium etli CNPAF512]
MVTCKPGLRHAPCRCGRGRTAIGKTFYVFCQCVTGCGSGDSTAPWLQSISRSMRAILWKTSKTSNDVPRSIWPASSSQSSNISGGVPVISMPSSVKTPDRGQARVCC